MHAEAAAPAYDAAMIAIAEFTRRGVQAERCARLGWHVDQGCESLRARRTPEALVEFGRAAVLVRLLVGAAEGDGLHPRCREAALLAESRLVRLAASHTRSCRRRLVLGFEGADPGEAVLTLSFDGTDGVGCAAAKLTTTRRFCHATYVGALNASGFLAVASGDGSSLRGVVPHGARAVGVPLTFRWRRGRDDAEVSARVLSVDERVGAD